MHACVSLLITLFFNIVIHVILCMYAYAIFKYEFIDITFLFYNRIFMRHLCMNVVDKADKDD